jgi:hypothetical protein
MKRNLIKTLSTVSVLTVLITMGTLNTLVAQSDLSGGRLEGTWEMQITLNDCHGHVIRSFPSLITFVTGGTVVESNGGTSPALKTPGEGVWHHTTDHDYAFSFKFFTFNSQNIFTGWTIITGETTLDRTGNANTGSAKVEVYDPNGVLLVSLCAETAGTRFEL